MPDNCRFDAGAVAAAAAAGGRRALTRFGERVVDEARRLLQPSSAVSAPGDPASSRTGAYEAGIRSAFDPATNTVVVGAVPFGGASGVPRLIELGGTTTVPGERRPRHYRGRPAVGPAFRSEIEGGSLSADLRSLFTG